MRKALWRLAAGVAIAALLAGCTGTRFEPVEVQGPIGLVQVDDQPQLWALQKQEEIREVRTGTGGRGRSVSSLRKDTYFHFAVQAFDPVTARPLWKQHLVSYHDKEVKPGQVMPGRVIGSSVGGRLLGQADGLVWALVDSDPYGLDARTGEIRFTPEGVRAARPELASLLPSEGRLWSFDGGLVVMLADARMVRLRGPDLQVEAYVARAPAVDGAPLKSNGMPRIVPLRPGVPVVRHVPRGENEWLALYTDVEAQDAINDGFGDHAMFPYSITDERQMARRQFRRIRLAPEQRFDETITRLVAQEPVPESPVLLRGRFVRDPATDQAVVMEDGDLLVWHRTRIDDEGRLALTRFSPELSPRWQVELPITDGGTDLPVLTWRIGDRLVAQGLRQDTVDHTRRRVPHLVSVDLSDGRLVAWDIANERPAEAIASP